MSKLIPVASAKAWWQKPLEELSHEQWEQLCDGCGKCCLHKLEDDDSNELFYTAVACRFLDHAKVRCRCYADRADKNADCLIVTPDNLSQISSWLPKTCAYRLLYSRQPLPAWHPLITQSRQSVEEAGQSVRFRCINEQNLHADADWEELILVDLI